MKRILFCILVLLIPFTAISQRGNNWVFGWHGGFTFNTTPSSYFSTQIQNRLSGSNLSEYTSTMSDCYGNLLFYGNNKQLWNRYHQPMKNGTANDAISRGYYGQYGVIDLPVPDSADRYYHIFFCNNGSPAYKDYLAYSIIDMRLANDSGAVVPGKKDIIIQEGHYSQKITAVKHTNNKDYWVITKPTVDSFYCFLVTSTGISNDPVKNYGLGQFSWGQIKLSPDGKKIISTGVPSNESQYSTYMFDIDRSTGKITNQTPVMAHASHKGLMTFGAEFSPDGKYIYISTQLNYLEYGSHPLPYTNYLYQVKNSPPYQRTVIKSMTAAPGGFCQQLFITQMELGPDDKIYGFYGDYGRCYNDTSITIIHAPNEAGAACNVELEHPSPSYALAFPHIIYQKYYINIENLALNGECVKDSAMRIIIADAPLYNEYTLYYGDGDSIIVANPFANGADTFYHYYPEGTYTISITSENKECNALKDFSKQFTVKFKPGIRYTLADSAACWEHHFAFKDNSLLTTSTKLLWGNGDTTNGLPNGTIADFYTTEDTFNYQYIAYNAQCSDTVTGQLIAEFLPKPKVRLGVIDSAFCQDESFVLTDSNTDVVDRSVVWGDGTVNNLLAHTYLDTGHFEVFVTDTATNGCYATDSITLSATDIEFVSTSGLTFNQACEEATLQYGYSFFNADSVIIDWGDGNYYQSNQFSDLLNHVYTQGNYTLRIMTFNSQCLDTVFSKPVELLPKPVADASVADNKLCEGQSITLSNSSTGASSYKVLWGDTGEDNYNFGTAEFNHTYTTDADVTVSVIALNAQNCPDTLKLPISVLPLPVAAITTDADSGCRPLDLGVVNNSTDYTSYFINWGDGSLEETGNIANSFSHQYTDKGSYPIMLGVSNGYCADTAYGSIKVTGLSGVETSQVVVATVDGVSSVYIEWDAVQGAMGYNLYRSANGTSYTLIAKKMNTTNYFDVVNTQANSWYYKVLGVDSCDNLSLESNIGRTIFLQGKVIGKNQAAMLNWSPYENWAGGVLRYELEVMDVFGGFNTLTAQQTLTQQDTAFLDLNRNEKCYRIVAYEQGGNNAVSVSNVVCLPYQPLLWAPNAFSPNGDGINDTWGVMHVAMQVFSFSIYTRWGEKVFESKYPTDTWDGANAPMGVYVYIINGRGRNGKPFIEKGEIHLIR